MTWDRRRERRTALWLDETVVCHIDQLLINRGNDVRRLLADVAALGEENTMLRAKLRRHSIAHKSIGVLAIACGLAACALL
jgi:hypothetical protein